jgi:hypothetical protein
VGDIVQQDGEFILRGRNEAFVTHTIECLVEHGIRVSDFRTAQPTLEDVFLRLTGHSIRA